MSSATAFRNAAAAAAASSSTFTFHTPAFHFPPSRFAEPATALLHARSWPHLSARLKLPRHVQDARGDGHRLTNVYNFSTNPRRIVCLQALHNRFESREVEGSSLSRAVGQRNTAVTKLVGMLTAMLVAISSMQVGAAEGAVDLDPRAETNFQRSCAGCHAGGGNILQPSATLFLKDLEKNGASSVDELYRITYAGKNRMPGYGEKCAPRGQCTFGPRLSDEDIKALAEFVKRKAEEGWVR